MQTYEAQQLVPNSSPVVYNLGNTFEYIRIRNESGYDLTVNITGMGTMSVAPWQQEDVSVVDQKTGRVLCTGQVQITAFNLANVAPSGFPSTYVIVTTFNFGELQQPMSVALTRLVSTIGGIASNIVNDGNVANTVFIEATVGTDVSSAVQLTNNGVLNLGNTVGRNGQIFLQGLAGQFALVDPSGNEVILTIKGRTVLNGGNSGTIEMVQWLQGRLIITNFMFINFQTGVSNQQILLPSTYSNRVMIITDNLGPSTYWSGFQILNGVSVKTGDVVTALSTLGGTTSPATTFYGSETISVLGPFDRLQLVGASAGFPYGNIMLIGQ